MRKNEKERNTKNQLKTEQLTLNLGLTEEKLPNSPKKFRSKYNALLSLLPEKTDKEYKVECGIIRRILSLGFKEIELYGVWNFYKFTRNQNFTSFKIFLWKQGQLIKEALPLLQKQKEVKVEINKEEDYRQNRGYKEKVEKSLIDFLNDESGSNGSGVSETH